MAEDREAFYAEVYSIVRQIPSGKVCTYGWIARLLGKPQYARRVGKALSEAPPFLHLPCHRVVGSQGRMVPHWPEQRELLLQEGVLFKKNGCVDLRTDLWEELLP